MGIRIQLEPDLQASFSRRARELNLDFDRVLNDAIRAGLSHSAPVARPRVVLPTVHLGTDRVDVGLASGIEDTETICNMRIAESRSSSPMSTCSSMA